MDHLGEKLGWQINATLDARNRTFYRDWIIDVLMDVPDAVWSGVESLHPFRGLFLDRLTSARRKQAAALKARLAITALQANFGAPSEADAWWYSTRQPANLPAAMGQEIAVYGPMDPVTTAYPNAWIAFIRPPGLAALEYSRFEHEPGKTVIADTEFLISSNVSW